jgi:RimJ/RimL family protein N-acetyltransferase
MRRAGPPENTHPPRPTPFGPHRTHSCSLTRNGYGSAVTAADLALGNGVDDVVLFADLANPVSNAIYQRIGFEPVRDYVRIEFGTLD